FTPSPSTLYTTGTRAQTRPSSTVVTAPLRPPKSLRRLPIVLRSFHDSPALRRSLLDLEPRPEHAKAAVVHFDNCLEVIEFEDAVPRTLAKLERDIVLHAGK